MSETKHTQGEWKPSLPSEYSDSICVLAWAGPTVRKICDVTHGNYVSVDQAKANAHLTAAAPELLSALEALLRRDERNTCQHEETTRGGIIWTICDQCGAKWADDEGGKPNWKDPPEWDMARAALAKAEGK